MLQGSQKLAVIADDLTGANDTGVQFSKHGVSTIVVFELDALESAIQRADVVVVNTDSRLCTPRSAYYRVRAAAEALKGMGISRIYKKIDSTLRGNIGAELDAAMDALGALAAFVVPAFPGAGRVTIGGTQLLGDTPLGESEVACDILTPVTESHVPTLLARQTARRVDHVSIEKVRSGVAVLRDVFSNEIQDGSEILIVDAVTDDDLTCIAQSISALDCTAVVAGSAGLASKIPQIPGIVGSGASREAGRETSGVLTAVGSVSPTVREQVERAMEELGLSNVVLDPNEILRGLDTDEGRTRVIVEEAVNHLSTGSDIIVSLSSLRSECADAANGIGTASYAHNASSAQYLEDSRRITQYLGRLCKDMLSACSIAGLVLTGGDTSLAVCKCLGAVGVRLVDEVVPGVPFGRLVGGPHSGMMIVTKAGSFGSIDTLVRSIKHLRQAVKGEAVEVVAYGQQLQEKD